LQTPDPEAWLGSSAQKDVLQQVEQFALIDPVFAQLKLATPSGLFQNSFSYDK
jgi:hypothetical protein